MSSSSAQQLAGVLVGRAFAQSQTSHSSTTISQHRRIKGGRPTKSGLAAQRRHTPVAGACFLYLIASLFGGTNVVQSQSAPVCTLLNGRLRFCSWESFTFRISV